MGGPKEPESNMQSWPPLICSQKKIIIFLILLHLTVHTDLKMIHFSNFRCSHSCHMTCYMTMLHCLQGALAFALLPCLWRSLTSFLPHTELKQTNWLCLRLKYTLMFPCNQPSLWQQLSAFRHWCPKWAAQFSLSTEGKGEFIDFKCSDWSQYFRRRNSAERFKQAEEK